MEEIDEPLKLGILLNLENFIHCFPTSFTSLERKFVHQCCHHLKILAKTIGKGTNKYVLCVKDPDILAVDEACSFALNPSTISQIGHLVNAYPLTHKERCDLLLRTERFGNNVTEDVERNKIVGRINIGIPLVPHCEHIAIDQNLPIYGFRKDILEMINNSPITIVDGPINSGKSTRIPLYLLEWAKVKKHAIKIIFVQNTKLQVVNSADYLAQLLGEKVGQTIGYQIRLESKVSPTSLLTFCTPWVLLRNLMTQDAELANLSHLFLDDLNERSASMELILMYLRQCCNFNHTSYVNLKNNNSTNNINNSNNVKFISPSTCKLVLLCNNDDGISHTKSELYNYFMDSSTVNANKGNTTSFCNSISVIMPTKDGREPNIESFYLEDILEIINYSYENETGLDNISFDQSYAQQFFETLTALLYQTKPTSTQDYNAQLFKIKQTEFQTLFSALPTNITNNCPEKSSNTMDLQRYLSNEPYMNTLMETVWILDVLTLSLNENKKPHSDNGIYENATNTYLGLVTTFFLKSIGSSVLMLRNTRLDINFFMMAAWLGNISVLKDLFDTSMRQTYDKFDCQNSIPAKNEGYGHINTFLNAISKYKGWIALDWAFHSPINAGYCFGNSNLEHAQILNDSFHKINLVDSFNYSAKDDNVNSSEPQNYCGSTYNSTAYDLIQTFYELTSLQPFEEAKLYLLHTKNQNLSTSPKTVDKLLNFYHSLYDTNTNTNNNNTVENVVIYTLKQLLLNICTQYTKEQSMDKSYESILAFNILCIMPLVDDLLTVRKIVINFLTKHISAHMNNQNQNVETLKFKTFMLFRDMHPQDLKPIYHSLLNQHSQSKQVNISFLFVLRDIHIFHFLSHFSSLPYQIFATDIVENYIPLPNIHSIIDFGLIYQEYYKLDQNASTLKQGWISSQNLANRQNILKTWISLPGHGENISRCYYAFYSKSRYHLICRTDEAINTHNANFPTTPQNSSICQYNSYVFGDISNIILTAKMLLNNTNSTLNTSTPYPSGLSLSDFLQKIPCNLTHSNHVRNKISPVTTKEEIKKEKSKSEENTYAQYLAKKIRTLVQNLKNIDILDDCGDITECGQHSLDIPLNPVWSRLIIHGLVFKCLDPILTIVSMLVTCLPFNNTGLPYLPANSILNYHNHKNCFQNEHYNIPKIDKSDLNNVIGGNNRRNSYEKMGALVDNRLSINGSHQIRIDKGSMSDHLLAIRIFQAWQKARLDGTESSFCHRYHLSSHLLESAYTLRSHLLGQLRASGLVRSSSCTASNVLNNNASSTNNNNNVVLSPNNINFMNSVQNVGSGAISGNGIESFGDIRDCNNNSESWPMVKACLTIALYPNIVKMIPDSSNEDPANKCQFSQSSYMFESSYYNKYLCSPSHTYLPFEVITLKTAAGNNKLAFYNPTCFIPKIHEIPAQNSSHSYKVQLNPTSIIPIGGAKIDNSKILHKNGENHPLWLIFTRFCGPTKYYLRTSTIDASLIPLKTHSLNLTNKNILSFISQCTLINPLTIILFGGPGKTPKDFIQDIENPDSLQNMASLVLQEESDSESETFYENTSFSQNVRNHKKRASLGDWIELKLDERLLLTQQSDLIRQCLALRQKYQSFILRRLRQPSKAWTHADDVLLRSLVQMLEQEDIQAGITPQPSGIGLRPKPLPIEYYNEVESNDAHQPKQNINYNFIVPDTVYNQRKSSGDINTQLPSQLAKLPPLKKLKFGLIKLEMQNNFTINNSNNHNYNNMINASNLIGKDLTSNSNFESTAVCPTNTNLVMLANSKPPKLGNPDDFCNYPAVEKDILAIIAKNTTNLISHYHQSNVNKSGHNNREEENENCLNLLLFVYKSKTRIFVGIFHVAIHWKEATLQNTNAESKKPQITSQHDWMIKKIANLIHIQSNCVPEFNTYLTNILTNPASYMDMEPDKAAYLFKYFDNPSKISFLQ